MLVSLWSLKGGAGCSVTAALVALHRARADTQGVVVADLCGDQPLVLGCPEPATGGVTDWLAAPSHPPGGVSRLVTAVAPGLGLITSGGSPWSTGDGDAGLVGQLAAHPSAVIVDAGCVVGRSPRAELAVRFAAEATRSILVTRACYLALARLPQMPVVPSGVVLVRERHRALTALDVEAAVGAPILAELEVDPAVARAVDAGLLLARQPRGLARVLQGVA